MQNKALLRTSHKVRRPENADVQRTGKYEFLRWNSDGNSYRGKLREKVRAMPRKMKITAENGLKIEKMGSTSPKMRFLGHFYGFRGLQA